LTITNIFYIIDFFSTLKEKIMEAFLLWFQIIAILGCATSLTVSLICFELSMWVKARFLVPSSWSKESVTTAVEEFKALAIKLFALSITLAIATAILRINKNITPYLLQLLI
jgi:hypothetical protein